MLLALSSGWPAVGVAAGLRTAPLLPGVSARAARGRALPCCHPGMMTRFTLLKTEPSFISRCKWGEPDTRSISTASRAQASRQKEEAQPHTGRVSLSPCSEREDTFQSLEGRGGQQASVMPTWLADDVAGQRRRGSTVAHTSTQRALVDTEAFSGRRGLVAEPASLSCDKY